LILVEPYFDLRTPNSIAAAGRAGGNADAVGGRVSEVTDYFKLFEYDINLPVNSLVQI
jgi:hypothetical protein